MSKKIIAFSILTLFAFVCWCGSKDDKTDTPQTDIENTEPTIKEEIPVAEKTDWEPVTMHWERGGQAVEVNENFEESI